MSSDLKDAKRGVGSHFPEKAIDAAGLKRVEPVLTGKELRKRWLFGLPLISPMTKEKVTDEDLNDYINRAMNAVEDDTNLDIAPVIRRHRLPFDPAMYHQFIYTEIPNKPIQKVLSFAICGASYSGTGEPNESAQYPNGGQIYSIPLNWLDMGNAQRGVLNITPLSPAFASVGANTAIGASGATLLQFIGSQGWVPNFFNVECLHGYCDEQGNVPVKINEVIGMKAAMLVITNLLPLYRFASQSLGIDGLSQSINDQAYALLQTKHQMLSDMYKDAIKKLRTKTGNNLFSSNV